MAEKHVKVEELVDRKGEVFGYTLYDSRAPKPWVTQGTWARFNGWPVPEEPWCRRSLVFLTKQEAEDAAVFLQTEPG